MIKVYAKFSNGNRFLAGKLCVAKCIPKCVDILMVKVNVMDHQGVVHGFCSNADGYQNEISNLRRFLSQAQIVPNIHVANLDIDPQRYQDIHDNIIRDAQAQNKWRFDFSGLGQKLERLINNQYQAYRDSYKAFLLGLPSTSGLIGLANDIPAKAAVISPLKDYSEDFSSVICHELCHCFGLRHSFTNLSPYTFPKLSTSNVMDYPNSAGLGLDLLTFWKWQWDMLRNAQGMRDIEMDLHYGFFKRLKLWWHG